MKRRKKMKNIIYTITLLTALAGCTDWPDCYEVAPHLCVSKEVDYAYDASLLVDKLNVMLKCADETQLKYDVLVKLPREEDYIYQYVDENDWTHTIYGRANVRRHIVIDDEIIILVSADLRAAAHEIGHVIEHQYGYDNLASDDDKYSHRPTGLAAIGNAVDKMFKARDYEKIEKFECNFDFGLDSTE